MSVLPRPPIPVFLYIIVTGLGILFSAMWGPGDTFFSLSATSVSCMLGGFSLWLWILQRTLEGQSIRPYIPRPTPKSGGGSSSNEILDWFRETLLRNNDRNWAWGWFLVYLLAFVLLLALVNLEIAQAFINIIYLCSISFYVFAGIIVPTNAMSG